MRSPVGYTIESLQMQQRVGSGADAAVSGPQRMDLLGSVVRMCLGKDI
jgi:hypothetical protein